jgi:hypothetical protein
VYTSEVYGVMKTRCQNCGIFFRLADRVVKHFNLCGPSSNSIEARNDPCWRAVANLKKTLWYPAPSWPVSTHNHPYLPVLPLLYSCSQLWNLHYKNLHLPVYTLLICKLPFTLELIWLIFTRIKSDSKSSRVEL